MRNGIVACVVGVGAVVCGASACLAGEPVVEIAVVHRDHEVVPQSRIEPGSYVATGVDIERLIADAFDADVRDVHVDFGAEQHGDDVFDVTITNPGADAQAMRAEVRKVVDSLVDAEFNAYEEKKTVYYLTVDDPAKLRPAKPADPPETSASMTNLDREHFDIECINCTAMMLARLGDITNPPPKIVPTGRLCALEQDRRAMRFDFTCANCTVESLLAYLREEQGFLVTPKEETVRYVWGKAKPKD